MGCFIIKLCNRPQVHLLREQSSSSLTSSYWSSTDRRTLIPPTQKVIPCLFLEKRESAFFSLIDCPVNPSLLLISCLISDAISASYQTSFPWKMTQQEIGLHFHWTRVSRSLCFSVVRQRPCHVGNTSSHSNTEVRQNWAWIVLGWETAWELPRAAGMCLLIYAAKGWVGNANLPPLPIVVVKPYPLEHLQWYNGTIDTSGELYKWTDFKSFN